MRKKLVFILIFCVVIAVRIQPAVAASDCTEPIPKLFQRVSPSVVYISAVTIDNSKTTNRSSAVMGSGIIISSDGLVLTNSHIVFGRQVITVILDDGKRTRAKLLGADPILDLAVLSIPAPHGGHPAATLGDSDKVQVGEDVVTIGNPFGLDQTLTRGVVSGINRLLPGSSMGLMVPLIQTDASINPGNSGGPLLNRCGEVIGINTLMLSDAQNIGFAVPVNIAKEVIPELIQHGRIIRPWFGMSGKLIKKEMLGIINIPLVDGFLVETIESGSPAQQAGVCGGELPVIIGEMEFLLGGDIITKINGQAPDDEEKFIKMFQTQKVGDRVHLSLYRGGKIQEVEFSLSEQPILPMNMRFSP